MKFIIAAISLVVLSLSSTAQTTTPSDNQSEDLLEGLWTVDQAIDSLKLAAVWEQTYPTTGKIWHILNQVQKIIVLVPTESLVQALLDFPVTNSFVRGCQIKALVGAKVNPAAKEFVYYFLECDDFYLQKCAVQTVLNWGEWEIAAPVLTETDNYGVLETVTEADAVPMLYWIIENEGLSAQYYAACALHSKHSDEKIMFDVCKRIAATAPLDDSMRYGAKYHAINFLGKHRVYDTFGDITRFFDDESEWVRSAAAWAMMCFLTDGSVEAKAALLKAANETSCPKLRHLAIKFLEDFGHCVKE